MAAAASSCMRMPTVRLLSLKIFCRFGRLVAAALIDAVEALGVTAGVIVESRSCRCRQLELVADGAGLNGLLDRLVGLAGACAGSSK